MLAGQSPRVVFLVGVLPALLVFWIRREVPETEEWHAARGGDRRRPGLLDLFRGEVRAHDPDDPGLLRALTAHWAFIFWYQQHLRNLPDLASWTAEEKSRFVSTAMFVVMSQSIAGNFSAAWLAKLILLLGRPGGEDEGPGRVPRAIAGLDIEQAAAVRPSRLRPAELEPAAFRDEPAGDGRDPATRHQEPAIGFEGREQQVRRRDLRPPAP